MKEGHFDINIELSSILNQYELALDKRKEFELGFNIFSLVSDTYHKENFHSEIIYTLLNPVGVHNEGRIFLDLFLEMLRIDRSMYMQNIKVFNEHSIENKKRIDILIQSDSNAIIIENKINNAKDMDNQLVDYYNHCKINTLEVDAILYLSIDANKLPDKSTWICDNFTKNEIENRLQYMGAFSIANNGTIFHWLEKCLAKAKNWDTIFIIKQYQQLLKSLRGYIMETTSLKNYYSWLTKQNLEKLSEIENLMKIHNNLNQFYPEKLIEAIPNERGIIWENTGVIFNNVGYDENYYLKVIFKNNHECVIRIQDNSRKWQHNTEFKNNKQLMDLFIDDVEFWTYKQNEYDLICNFNKVVEDIKEVLSLLTEIIEKK